MAWSRPAAAQRPTRGRPHARRYFRPFEARYQLRNGVKLPAKRIGGADISARHLVLSSHKFVSSRLRSSSGQFGGQVAGAGLCHFNRSPVAIVFKLLVFDGDSIDMSRRDAEVMRTSRQT